MLIPGNVELIKAKTKDKIGTRLQIIKSQHIAPVRTIGNVPDLAQTGYSVIFSDIDFLG
jgi:hypothetical protein